MPYMHARRRGWRSPVVAAGCLSLVLATGGAVEGAQRGDDSGSSPLLVAENVVYLEGGDPVHNALDVYASSGVSGLPVLFYVHGGALRGGDKRNLHDKPQFFAERGFVLVSTNYRLSPEVVHPAHIEDVAAAVAWVVENVHDYGGDPERLVYMGHSSGALLGGLLTTDEHRLGAHDLSLDTLKGAVLLDGHTYNLAASMESFHGKEVPKEPISKFTDRPEVWRDATAMEHIAKGKGIPPMLLVSGGIQFQHWPVGEAAEEFAAALREAGGEAEVFMAEGKDHGDVNRDVTSGDEMSRAILEFLVKRAR